MTINVFQLESHITKNHLFCPNKCGLKTIFNRITLGEHLNECNNNSKTCAGCKYTYPKYSSHDCIKYL